MRGSMECATLNVHAYKLSCKSFLCKPKKSFMLRKLVVKNALIDVPKLMMIAKSKQQKKMKLNTTLSLTGYHGFISGTTRDRIPFLGLHFS